MAQPNKSLLMGAVPGIALAALMVFVIPSSALVGAQNVTTDGLTPHGYVVVSVTRDGQEIYHSEDHNLITNAGKDFIAQQIGASTGLASEGAHYIALTTDGTAPAATDTTLASEITSGGLARASGTYAHTSGTNTFTVSNTFTASATHTNVQKAGLFTASSGGTMMAENTFTAVSLASGDQLTITWTITLS
ncbi:phage tail fiber protein [Nitrososphaera viennensis]|uniref:Uncharacterized protein n=2 Tax=Nitrososphaera viennensis TaxID=1034015 RepID=A0A060HF89_9ARCH|nr:hypothetical protein [Nitrososphaera viennensis]AIC14278.1 hypothetical protein NVIE_000970 [Nitrososphaera viennensis EN76]UVS69274.1 hypothetical protein NWT39_00455 [Nitrososphaera viennensis]